MILISRFYHSVPNKIFPKLSSSQLPRPLFGQASDRDGCRGTQSGSPEHLRISCCCSLRTWRRPRVDFDGGLGGRMWSMVPFQKDLRLVVPCSSRSWL